jgi:hypothetical protein
MEVELRNKARKHLDRMSEPHKSVVIETADAEEISMIEEGMREYEKDPSTFTNWRTVKKEWRCHDCR